MNKKAVLNKLNKQLDARKTKLQSEIKSTKRMKRSKYFDPKQAVIRLQSESDRLNIRNITYLTYKIRSNYFSNSSGSCGFDPVTMDGHSYSWYSLVKKIKGTVVLNTYKYSNQTAQHIGKVSNVLRVLGIKYKTLDAPRGLQDLDSCHKYELSQLAEAIVKETYCRNPDRRWLSRVMKTKTTKNLTFLSKLGHKTSDKAFKQAISDAETYRRARLNRLNEKRAEKRAMSKLIIEIDAENKRASESALHVIKPHAWSWTETNEFTGSVTDYERREALSKGFNKIIVHKEAPKHLSIVGA